MSEPPDSLQILETERLLLRKMTPADAGFMLKLLNDPAWIRYIGDRGVRTEAAARDYVVRGPMDSYARHGFGFFAVELRGEGRPLGICGLVQRQFLDAVDVGFAFLPEHRGHGYAHEAAAAVLSFARDTLGLARVLAITDPENQSSIRLLEKLGLRFARRITTPEGEELCLFEIRLRAGGGEPASEAAGGSTSRAGAG